MAKKDENMFAWNDTIRKLFEERTENEMPPIKRFKYSFTTVIHNEFWHIHIKRLASKGKRVSNARF